MLNKLQVNHNNPIHNDCGYLMDFSSCYRAIINNGFLIIMMVSSPCDGLKKWG
jgi:hypothetical protein